MRLLVVSYLAIIMFGGPPILATAAGSQLQLVSNAEPASTIVVPQDAGYWTLKAAEWLQGYILKASGAKLQVVTEEQAPEGTLVSVGHTQLAKEAGIDVSTLKWDGCKMQVKGDVLFLIGRDQVIMDLHVHAGIEEGHVSWVGAKGTCKAVVTFLEDIVGVRWFLPTPMGEWIPLTENIAVSRSWNKTFVPAFAYSEGRSVYNKDILNEPGGTPASIANNYRKAVAVAGGGHTYYHAVPAEKYGVDHPEYFALINGKRQAGGGIKTLMGNHLCSSNPDVKRILVSWMQTRFDQGLDWQSLGQEDGYQRCECEKCEQLDDYRFGPGQGAWEVFQTKTLRETPPERLFLLHKAVIDELAQSHPDKKVLLMSYAPTAWPSEKIDYFGDNVIIELMNPNPDYLAAWRGKSAGIVCKTDWFNIQCPMGMNIHLTPREVAARIRFLHDNGVVGLGQYAEANWGMQGPMFYMMGKLLGDPSLDERLLIEEYCHGVYGQAGATMLQFFDLLYPRIEEIIPLERDDIVAHGRNVFLPTWAQSNTAELYLRYYPRVVLDELERLLRRAESEADTPMARGWLRLSRDFFDFTKLLTQSLAAYRDFQRYGTEERWLAVKQSVEQFDAHRTKIINYSQSHVDNWFPGHDQVCNWITADNIREQYSYYVSWAKRKAEVIRKGIPGTAMGHGASRYHSYVKEPLTLDFNKVCCGN